VEYVTSHRLLFGSREEMNDGYWFNMWQRQLWPYREVVTRDVLFWYHSPSRRILWRSRIDHVERFSYQSKIQVAREVEKRFDIDFDPTPNYFDRAPSRGYCLAWTATNFVRVDLPKPRALKFPQQGWLRVSSRLTEGWLGNRRLAHEAILDDLAPKGSLREQFIQLDRVMSDPSPERRRMLVSQSIRRDSSMIRALKKLQGFTCQSPGCAVRIKTRSGSYYVEVHHLEPVREGGKSTLGNLLVLCPNHHKEFEHGELAITEQSPRQVCGILNGRVFKVRFP